MTGTCLLMNGKKEYNESCESFQMDDRMLKYIDRIKFYEVCGNCQNFIFGEEKEA